MPTTTGQSRFFGFTFEELSCCPFYIQFLVSPAGYSMSVFHLWPLEPDVRAWPHHRPLDDPHQTSVDLADLSDQAHRAVTSSHPDIRNKRHAEPFVDDTHHGIAAIIGQNHNVDGWGVIGNADSSFLRLILSVGREWFFVSATSWLNCDESDDIDLWLTCCGNGWWLTVLWHRSCSRSDGPPRSASSLYW